MKHFFASLFLIGLCSMTGCFTSAPPKVMEHEENTAIVEPREPTRMTADQVNPTNVQEKAAEFAEELGRDEKRQLLKTPH